MRDLQANISRLRYFEFEVLDNSTNKRRKEVRASLSAYAPKSYSRKTLRSRAATARYDNSPLPSHNCVTIGDYIKPKDSQNILVGSALRRPHATEYSTMDYQRMPEVGKSPKQPYRPQTASTVYTYANRPVSAADVGTKHGQQTKSSLLRKKSSSCESLGSLTSSKSFSRITSANSKKRLCKIREDYRPFKGGFPFQLIPPNGESLHSFLIGARYNNTRFIDSKTLSKLGVYVPKTGLKMFFVKENNWIKQPYDDGDDIDHSNELDMVAVIDQGSGDLQSHSTVNKAFKMPTDSENKAVNTDPHYLSIDRWHSAEWCTEKIPTSQKAPRAHTAPSRFKPINTFYYDYDSGKKYKYGT